MRTNPFSDRNVSIQESKQKRPATKERTREIGKTQGKREDREKERKGRSKREREREREREAGKSLIPRKKSSWYSRCTSLVIND